jgi:hypothetical protein
MLLTSYMIAIAKKILLKMTLQKTSMDNIYFLLQMGFYYFFLISKFSVSSYAKVS